MIKQHHHIKRHHYDCRELTPVLRVAVTVAAAIQLVLLLAALLDIRKRAAGELRGSKGMWVAISFVNFIGPIAYFLWGRKAASGDS
jgi:hypothetical protein